MNVTSNAALEQLFAAREWIKQHHTPLILVTVIEVVGSNPQQVGARMLVWKDGFQGTVGGGKIEATVLEEARRMLKEGTPTQVQRINLQDIGMTCGGRMDFFFERMEPAPHALVFGGGHIAQPTVSMLSQVGFRVSVIEEREEWATPSRFPDAEIHCLSYEVFLEQFQPQPHHFVLLITQGHARDQVILEKWIEKPLAFLGMIGSRQKAHRMKKTMLARGVSEADWERVQCPVGLEIGGQHPNEIAVSIVAQMVQARYVQNQREKT